MKQGINTKSSISAKYEMQIEKTVPIMGIINVSYHINRMKILNHLNTFDQNCGFNFWTVSQLKAFFNLFK